MLVYQRVITVTNIGWILELIACLEQNRITLQLSASSSAFRCTSARLSSNFLRRSSLAACRAAWPANHPRSSEFPSGSRHENKERGSGGRHLFCRMGMWYIVAPSSSQTERHPNPAPHTQKLPSSKQHAKRIKHGLKNMKLQLRTVRSSAKCQSQKWFPASLSIMATLCGGPSLALMISSSSPDHS